MADVKDISEVIESALTEVGVSGSLDVSGDGATIAKSLGASTGDDVVVKVVVVPANEAP